MPALIDDNYHCFRVPARLRADSDGMLPVKDNDASGIDTNSGGPIGGGTTTVSAGLLDDNISVKAVFEGGLQAIKSTFSSGGTDEESKSQRCSSSTLGSSDLKKQGIKFHPAQVQAMNRFSTSKSQHGGGGNRSRYTHSQKSHHSRHSGRNLSVSSLPTITEEKREKTKQQSVKQEPKSQPCNCGQA